MDIFWTFYLNHLSPLWGYFYSIDEQLTEHNLELKRRIKVIVRENHQMPTNHQLDIESRKGKLIIDGTEYSKVVDPPKAKEVLLASHDQKDEFRLMSVQQGDTKSHGGSKFIDYVSFVKSFEEVKKAYLKIKDANMCAAHIMCGFRLFGQSFHVKQDYSDDGEVGGGTTILAKLKELGVNIAVFVARYYDGVHIGKRRFELILDIIDGTLGKLRHSLDYGQNENNPGLLKSLRRAVKKSLPQQNNEDKLKTRRQISNRGGRGGHRRARHACTEETH